MKVIRLDLRSFENLVSLFARRKDDCETNPWDLRRRIRWNLDLSKNGFVTTPRDLFATCYKMKTIVDKGWTKVIIDDNCGFDRFYLIALILERTLKSSYTKKLTGV